MKTGIGYYVTADLIGEFYRAQRFQSELFPIPSDYARLIVSNAPCSYHGIETSIVPEISTGADLCEAKARNRAIDWGRSSGLDTLLLLDLDLVLLEPIPLLPAGAFSAAKKYSSTAIEVATRKFKFQDESRWGGGSWFTLSRDAMHHHWCEDFRGYGSADTDYHWNVLVPAGLASIPWTPRILHLWHPVRPATRPHALEAKELFAKRFAAIHGRAGIDKLYPWADKGFVEMVISNLDK